MSLPMRYGKPKSAKIKNMSGFLEGRGPSVCRASNRANDSAVNLVGVGRPRSLFTRERRRRINGTERMILLIVERRFPKCSMRDMIAKKEE